MTASPSAESPMPAKRLTLCARCRWPAQCRLAGACYWPAGSIGQPPRMREGRRVDVYLDAATIERAREIGGGNISEGIRRALARRNA